jgi:hypothetical protein
MLVSRAVLLGGAIVAAALTAACSSSITNNTGGTTSGTGATGPGGSGGTSDVGTTTGTTGTTSTGTGAGGKGSLTDDPPQVINSGGTIITSPKVQLVAYASDPTAPDAIAALTELGATPTWMEQAGEYGIGAFTQPPAVMLSGAPPSQLDDTSGNTTPFQQMIIDNTTGANPAWGAYDPSTIYMFIAPIGTDVSSSGHCCSDYLGYHWEAPLPSGGSIPYAVVCDCAAQMGDPLTPLQYVTTTINHELVEAATDPFPDSNPAYAWNDDDHLAWTIATGGEVADMCEYNADSNVIPPGATYMIQRTWSNAAAKAGQNPCVPVPTSDPYFNSLPVLPDTVSIDALSSPSPTKGITIPVGQSKTIDVQLVSAAPTSGPWKVTAYDLNDYLGFGSPFLQLTLDKDTGSNGDVLHLTIKSLKKDQQDGAAIFVLQSDLGSQENLSLGAVGY